MHAYTHARTHRAAATVPEIYGLSHFLLHTHDINLHANKAIWQNKNWYNY